MLVINIQIRFKQMAIETGCKKILRSMFSFENDLKINNSKIPNNKGSVSRCRSNSRSVTNSFNEIEIGVRKTITSNKLSIASKLC
ncbi:hypothetical protein ES708_26918 [subsurface metagenome]